MIVDKGGIYQGRVVGAKFKVLDIAFDGNGRLEDNASLVIFQHIQTDTTYVLPIKDFRDRFVPAEN